MNIELKHLGAVKSAEIDISKPLTVFCGPNNSGKTYVSFIIYALTKIELHYINDNSYKEIISRLITNGSETFEIDVHSLLKYRKNKLVGLEGALDSIFGISDDTVQRLFKDFEINIKDTEESQAKNIKEMDFTHHWKEKNIDLLIEKKQGNTSINLTLNSKNITENNIELLYFFLVSKLYSLVAFFPFTSNYILPVERNSIYTFSKELSIQKQEFLERAQDLGTKQNQDPLHWLLKRSTRYPLPIRDGLTIAEDLSNATKTKGEYYHFAEIIESELLQGKMEVSKDGDVLFKSNNAKIKKIPIHLSASIIKTLSSLVFYLKYIAKKNDLIIIDEPELNLHPNNQVILTQIFAKLMNKGFRLLISTHSDYIIRELNNLIMASSVENSVKKLAEKLGYSDDINLLPKDINVYLFDYKNSRAKNVTVSQVEVNEFGFDVATIDKTIDELNNVSEQLFYEIKYGSEIDE